jgi:hypothetical protein
MPCSRGDAVLEASGRRSRPEGLGGDTPDQFRWFWRNPGLVRSGGRASQARSPAVLASARVTYPGAQSGLQNNRACGAPEGAACDEHAWRFGFWGSPTPEFGTHHYGAPSGAPLPSAMRGAGNRVPARPRRKEWGGCCTSGFWFLSCPAKAGHPVTLKSQALLDRPPARAMTKEIGAWHRKRREAAQLLPNRNSLLSISTCVGAGFGDGI